LFGFYVANTCVSYLFSYKGLLASADQKNYIQLRNHYVFIIALNVTQIFVIYFTRNFVAYAAVQSFFTIAEGVSLSVIMDRKYPILKRKDKITLPKDVTHRIWSDVRKIVVGKVGGTIIGSTDNLILANVVGLSTTGVYNNYVLVKSSLQAIVCQFQSAVSASIGNIAASGEREKELDYFWFLNFITVSLYAVTGVCMFNLMQPFIAYWLGGDYLMDYSVLFCITAIYYFGGIRGIFGAFSMAHGIFDLEAKRTVLEALVNLVVSIILGWKLGLIGVLLGTIISSVFVGLPLEFINVSLALPEISKRRYVENLFIYTAATVIAWFISMKLCNLVSMHWYIRLPLGFLISVAVFLGVWWAFFGRTEAFRRTLELGKGLFRIF
jgi:O-antigen/teichoic acid export membrane protein